MAIGDFGEGFAWSHHHHLLGHGGRGQQHRHRRGKSQDQGGKGAAHGLHGSLAEP